MKQKLKSFGIPIILSLLGIGALFLHQLFEEKQPPQEDWSRSLPLGFATEEKPLTFNNESDLFITNFDYVQHYKIDKDLQLTNKGKIPTKVTRGYPFWTDGEQFIMKKDESLVFVKGKEETTIDQGVTGITTSAHTIYYWKKQELYQYDLEQQQSTLLHTFSHKILDGYINHGKDAILKVRLDDSRAQLYYMDESKKVNSSPFLTFQENTTNQITSLSFKKEQQKLTVVFNERLRAQGTLSYYVKKVDVSVDNINAANIEAETLAFKNVDTNKNLQAPRAAQLVTINGTGHVLFTAEGQHIGDNSAIRLYIAPYKESGALKARSINTTNKFTYSPLQISENEIVWFNFNGDTYELFGASQNEQVIAKSTELTDRSTKVAINNAILMLFSGVVTLLVSIYWALPPLFLLILLYMTKSSIFEQDKINWVEYVSILLFAIMPITFVSKAFSDYFYTVAPNYFTFTGSAWVLLAVFTILSALMWKFGRDPEWGTFAGVFYFIGVYILLFISTVGPYIFNLF